MNAQRVLFLFLIQCKQCARAASRALAQLDLRSLVPCAVPTEGYAAIQRQSGLKFHHSRGELNTTLFQVKDKFYFSQADPCNPVCRWTCDNAVCEEVCAPLCEPPRCETRCRAFDTSQCTESCSEPQCTVTCPNSRCEKTHCSGCFTSCQKPSCFLNCSSHAQSCDTVCEDPVCEWDCQKPATCPAPRCKMQCDMPKACATRSVEPLKPAADGETVVTFSAHAPPAPRLGGDGWCDPDRQPAYNDAVADTGTYSAALGGDYGSAWASSSLAAGSLTPSLSPARSCPPNCAPASASQAPAAQAPQPANLQPYTVVAAQSPQHNQAGAVSTIVSVGQAQMAPGIAAAAGPVGMPTPARNNCMDLRRRLRILCKDA